MDLAMYSRRLTACCEGGEPDMVHLGSWSGYRSLSRADTLTAMPRPRTGSLQRTKNGLWQAVVTLADGTRKRLPPFPAGTSRALAQERAQKLADQYAHIDPGLS